MTAIEIEYCVPCGLRQYATETQNALLDEYGRSLDEVALKPSGGGVFRVTVDGQNVFDKDEAESGYDLEAITESVQKHATEA